MHHRQIMADEQAGEAVVLTQIGAQFQYLRLYRHIQRTGGFVGDHQAWRQRQGPRQHHPLSLPTGHLGGSRTAIPGAGT